MHTAPKRTKVISSPLQSSIRTECEKRKKKKHKTYNLYCMNSKVQCVRMVRARSNGEDGKATNARSNRCNIERQTRTHTFFFFGFSLLSVFLLLFISFSFFSPVESCREACKGIVTISAIRIFFFFFFVFLL